MCSVAAMQYLEKEGLDNCGVSYAVRLSWLLGRFALSQQRKVEVNLCDR